VTQAAREMDCPLELTPVPTITRGPERQPTERDAEADEIKARIDARPDRQDDNPSCLEEIMRDALALNLRRMRRAKGFSPESLAWEAGSNRSYMAKIETGATWVGLEIICKLAEATEIEPAELLRPPPRRGAKATKR
jgi:ribosome-binding protein aMBF1 (putative translation factor)